MLATVNTKLQTTDTSVAASQNSDVAQLDRIEYIDVTAVIAAANPSAATFTALASTDVITTASAHGFLTGMLAQVSNSGGALPTGLSAATNYYVIYVSDTTFKLATSQANALAGTAIDLTTNGTGTQTITPTTTLAGTIKLQKTNDPTSVTSPTWIDLVDAEVVTVTASQTISAASTKNWVLKGFTARALRAVTTVTSGTLTADIRLHGKQS